MKDAVEMGSGGAFVAFGEEKKAYPGRQEDNGAEFTSSAS